MQPSTASWKDEIHSGSEMMAWVLLAVLAAAFQCQKDGLDTARKEVQ